MHTSYNYAEGVLNEYKEEIWLDFKKPLPSDIERCLEFIEEHLYDSSLTIAELKEVCKITNRSFSGKFDLYTSYTPKQFILYHRINASMILLRKTNFTVAQISLSVGFSSHSSFCKAFKSYTGGVKPSVWREEKSGKNSGQTSG